MRDNKHETKLTPAELDALKAEAQGFLDQFASALMAGDGKTIATLWEIPALVVGDSEARAVTSRKEIEHFFEDANQQYTAQGIVETRAIVIGVTPLTAAMTLVEVRWPYLDRRGVEVGAEISTYLLRRVDTGNLRLQAAMMHGVTASVVP